MQDNNWTDDAEFWNEAWTDMAGRLDARQRRFPAWLWLLPLLLLGGLAFLYFPQDKTDLPVGEAPQVQRTDLITSPDGPVLHAKTGNEDERSGAAERTARRFAGVTVAPPVTGLYTNPAPSSPTIAPAPRAKNDVPAAPRIAAGRAPVALPDPTGPAPLDVNRNYVFPTVEAAPVTSVEEELITPKKSRRWLLEGGGSTDERLEQPGIYGGLAFTVWRSGKFDFPLHLRYYAERRAIQRITLSDAITGEFVDLQSPDQDNTEQRVYNGLRLSNMAEIRHQNLELAGGVGFRISPKFRAFGLAGVNYLTRFSGPSVTDVSGRNLLNFSPSTAFGNLSSDFMVVQVPTIGANADDAPPVGVNRWWFSGELGLQYAIGDRFSTSLSARHLLGPQTTDDAVRFNRFRVMLGAGYRF